MTDDKAKPMTVAEYLSAEAWAEREFPSRPERGVPTIEMDTTPVRVRGDALHPVWWRGRQWAVTELGVEALDGTYFFEARRLVEDIEVHPWPLHMAEKNWVDVDDFTTAWMVALVLHGMASKVKPERLLQIFARLPRAVRTA